ncbi:hypothetical protein ACJJIG_17350 [Microbulbifer sp. SSSA007]|uniref:hypothetical protein n=1 Tax=Microbulbifer sp. SSSA007 TaxID=3243379 RepID=UPI004039CD46
MLPRDLKYKLHLHIGKLGDVSLKHRSSVLLLSVLMFLVDPTMQVTLGKASVAGLGISVDPPQTIHIGIFLLILLLYRLVAFWVSVLLESGTDESRATRKALLDFDPAWEAEKYRHRPGDMEQLIKNESGAIVYKWSVRQILWEFVLPNVLALTALVKYVAGYV